MDPDDTEQVAEAVGEATGAVVEAALEGASERADAAQQTAEAIADAALATAQGQHIQQVEHDTWREIGLLRERGDALEARLDAQAGELSSLRETQLSLSADQMATLLAMLAATPSTPPPPPTPPEPEPPQSPAVVDDAPAGDPVPPAPKRRHRFL